MNIRQMQPKDQSLECDVLLLPVFESEVVPQSLLDMNPQLAEAVSSIWNSEVFRGECESSFVLPYPGGKPRFLILIGMGEESKLSGERCRRTFACAAAQKVAAKARSVAVCTKLLSTDLFVKAALEGFLLAGYKFNKHKTENTTGSNIPEEIVVLAKDRDLSIVIAEIPNMYKWVCFTRDLVNEPANFLTPVKFSEIAKEMSQDLGVEYGKLSFEELVEKGFGCLTAVGQGSANEPCLFWMRYEGDKDNSARLALVGKGLTFDSGGLCIKTGDGMLGMKGDMGGAAAVLGAFGYIVSSGLKINVDVVVGAVENMPSGTAYRPGDILKSYSGKTVQVINTDAEGRLVLADALTFAVKDMKASTVVDVATLTGAASVALGRICTAVMTNCEEQFAKLNEASKETHELVWQLPMFEEYRKMIECKIADVKHRGVRGGGAISAAKFLEEFVEGTPWLHVDIAPTSHMGGGDFTTPYDKEAGNGVMVRTLYAFASLISK